MPFPLKIAVSAGELSGDQHLSKVVEALRARYPDAVFKGMGGRNLRAERVDTVVDSERDGSVMGFLEVLMKLPKVFAAYRTMAELLRSWCPSVLVVVDFPDFHLRLARVAKRCGIPVVYYIPPKVWVWRSSRVKLLKEYATELCTIFPFEKEFFRARGVSRVSYVGHPFTDDLTFTSPPLCSRDELCSRYSLDPSCPLLLVLPGSRAFEVERHCPVLFGALSELAGRGVEFNAIVSVAPTVSLPPIPEALRGRVVAAHEPARELMKVCDVGVLKSGTCNLEAAFIGLPFVCIYSVLPYQAVILRSIAGVKTASILNYIEPDTVTELLQERFNPVCVAAEIERLLAPEGRRQVCERLERVVAKLNAFPTGKDDEWEGALSAPARVAQVVSKVLEEHHQRGLD